jgi:hypothetical protein
MLCILSFSGEFEADVVGLTIRRFSQRDLDSRGYTHLVGLALRESIGFCIYRVNIKSGCFVTKWSEKQPDILLLISCLRQSPPNILEIATSA